MGNFITRFDTWIGLKLFHPIIIFLCQITNQTQYAFSRSLWFMYWVVSLYYNDSVIWQTIAFVCALGGLIGLGMFPDKPVKSYGWVRLSFWVILIVDLIPFLSLSFYTIAISILLLFAEYALTIKTIPPIKKKEKLGKVSNATQ